MTKTFVEKIPVENGDRELPPIATGGLIILGSPLVEIMYYCAWIYSDQIGTMAQGVLGNNSEDPLCQNGSINPYVMKVRSLMARHLA